MISIDYANDTATASVESNLPLQMLILGPQQVLEKMDFRRLLLQFLQPELKTHTAPAGTSFGYFSGGTNSYQA